MLIDEIKKANMMALKEHDNNKRSVYSIIISRYSELVTNGSGKEITDSDIISLLQKMKKELEEERLSYEKAGRKEQEEAIRLQLLAVEPFLPKQMSEDDIKAVIESLPDKSIPSVMKHFKANYAGQVDMSLVNRLARAYN